MSPYDDRDLRSLLTPEDRPTPPSNLAARIKADIPDDLAFSPPETPVGDRVSEPIWHRRGWLLAASLVTILGGVWLAGRTMTEMPVVEMPVVEMPVTEMPVADRAKARAELPASRADDHMREALPEAVSATRAPASATSDVATQQPSEAERSLVIVEEVEKSTRDRSDREAPAAGSERQRTLAQPPAHRARAARAPVVGTRAEAPAVTRPLVVEPDTDDARLNAWSVPAESQPAESLPAESQPAGSLAAEAAPDRLAEALGARPSAQAETAVQQQAATARSKRVVPSSIHPPRIATASHPDSVFPLVVDTSSYDLVRRLVDEGVWPPPEVVRVNAMVNRFDYGDLPPAGEDFALYAEGTSVPPRDEGVKRVLLRVGVRARANDLGAREGGVVATAALAWVSFNPRVVARYRLLGGDDRRDAHSPTSVAGMGAIRLGHAVTALYEIELYPHVATGAGERDDVAMLHLEWSNAGTGESVTRSRPITGDDIASDWRGASVTLRWSVLVARLADALQRGGSGTTLENLREETERLSPHLLQDPGFAEFRALVARVDDLPR